ncbi:MAG: glycosyltransferase family 39 protein [Verrucomicrobiota bacterium]
MKLKTSDVLCLLFLWLMIAGLAWLSWGKCGHFVKDYGREITHAWKVADGQVLYDDAACLFGPLGAYVNATIFRIFGYSITKLQIIQLVLFTLFSTSLFLFLKEAFNTILGFLGSFAVVSIHGFGFQGLASTFNFLAPYTHNATYGFYLCWMMLLFLFLDLAHRRREDSRNAFNYWVLCAGLCSGLGFQTKSDIALGCLGIGFGWFLLCIYQRNFKFGIKQLVVLVLGFWGGHIFMLLYLLLWGMPFETSLYALVGSWLPIFHSGTNAGFEFFYKAQMGLLNPLTNILEIFKFTLFYLAILGMILIISGACWFKEFKVLKLGVIFTALLAIFLVVLKDFSWMNFSRPYLLINISVLVFLLINKNSCLRVKSEIALWMLSFAALALSVKMLLLPRIYHYGFYLGIFSVIIVLLLFYFYFPKFATYKSQYTHLNKQALWGQLLFIYFFITVFNLGSLTSRLKFKEVELRVDQDNLIYLSREDKEELRARDVMEFMSHQLGEDERFLAVPYGSLINYFLNSHVPTKYDVFMPPEIKFFGEKKMIADLEMNSSDYVINLDQIYKEYGVEFEEKGLGKFFVN